MDSIEVNSISESVNIQMMHGDNDVIRDVSSGGDTCSDDVETTNVESQCSKRTKSDCWDSFTRYLTPAGVQRAKCNWCDKTYAADTKKDGTRNLNKHKLVCPKRDTQDVKQMIISHESKIRSRKIDQALSREMLADAIVTHNLPFSFVEFAKIRKWTTYLNPDLKHICRNTSKLDVLKMYCKEKDNLKDVLTKIKSRICLTSDLWTSITNDGYMTVTIHYVDETWKLQSRIIKFFHFIPPHTGIALGEKMLSILKHWGIEKKIFSITLDNATSNDTMQQCIKRQLRAENSLLCDGKHFHVRCCAHILNLIVQEGLKVIDGGLKKIRESVKYVKASSSRKIAFAKCVDLMKIETSIGLRMDVPTRWNSTFFMLESALLYRKAFDQFQYVDAGYTCVPTEEEWNLGERICDFLRPFEEVSTLFSGREYVTSNLYFLYVWRIHYNLVEESRCANDVVGDMAVRMMKKFEKYWDEYSCVLAFALALDPRYKLDFISFCYEKLDTSPSKSISNAKLERVKKEMYELYDAYSNLVPTTSSRMIVTSSAGSSVSNQPKRSADADFDTIGTQLCHGIKTELDIYLEDARYSRVEYPDLDVLDYWKTQKDKYPILSMMARDILTIPITTVASESAFNMGSRLLTKYRSTVLPENVEAIICLQNWTSGYEVTTLDNVGNLDVHLDENCHFEDE